MAGEGNKCRYLIRDDICGGNLDVCCVYQNGSKYSLADKEHGRIQSVRETFCDYPNASKNTEYVKAIESLAALLKGGGD